MDSQRYDPSKYENTYVSNESLYEQVLRKYFFKHLGLVFYLLTKEGRGNGKKLCSYQKWQILKASICKRMVILTPYSTQR
jgi:hypothetical protein